MRVVSCQQDDWDVGSFGHECELRCVPRNDDAGRHDCGEFVDAKGKDLFRLSRRVGGSAAACARRERIVRELSRRAQQRVSNAVARGGCATGAKARFFAWLDAALKGRSSTVGGQSIQAVSSRPLPHQRFEENTFIRNDLRRVYRRK